MAECFRCEQDMNVASGCADDRVITFTDGETADPIPYGEGRDYDPDGPCHDCGAFPDQYHHPGCDMETCPRCGEQYFICSCATAEKREIWTGVDG